MSKNCIKLFIRLGLPAFNARIESYNKKFFFYKKRKVKKIEFTRSIACVLGCVTDCSNIDFRFDRLSIEGPCFLVITDGSVEICCSDSS